MVRIENSSLRSSQDGFFVYPDYPNILLFFIIISKEITGY